MLQSIINLKSSISHKLLLRHKTHCDKFRPRVPINRFRSRSMISGGIHIRMAEIRIWRQNMLSFLGRHFQKHPFRVTFCGETDDLAKRHLLEFVRGCRELRCRSALEEFPVSADGNVRRYGSKRLQNGCHYAAFWHYVHGTQDTGFGQRHLGCLHERRESGMRKMKMVQNRSKIATK